MDRSAAAIAVEAAAFSFMVGVVAAVAMIVMGGKGLLTAVALAIALAGVVYLVVMRLNGGGKLPPPRGPGNLDLTNTRDEVRRDTVRPTEIRGPVVDGSGRPVTGSRAPATAAGGVEARAEPPFGPGSAERRADEAAPDAAARPDSQAADSDTEARHYHDQTGQAASDREATASERHAAAVEDGDDGGNGTAKSNGSAGGGQDDATEVRQEKPQTLSEPRGGEADDLKKIRGVGPKLEEMLHGLGFYHFDQIAGWTPEQAAWVDAHLEGFNGRVARDDWVAQAKTLAAGGSSDFSERVAQGDVY